MKTNKSIYAFLITWSLLLGACQPQAATSPGAPSSGSASSPEATEAPQALSSALFAKLSELTGKVELKQAAQSVFAPASTDMQLEVNGKVQTQEDGRVRLDLSSGTIIRVAPSSLFTLTSNEEVEGGLLTKIQLELGKVFIILSGGSAEVKTPSGVASVVGSYLKVEFDPATGELTLTCLEGSCSVTTPDGETKNFTDGQKIKIHKDPQTGKWIMDEGPMSPEDFQEWLDANPEAKALVDAAAGGGSSGDGSGDGEGSCLSLIEPISGAALPFQGKVKFEWDAQPGAAKYIVKFTNASGDVVTIATTKTSLELYIEGVVPEEGTSNWSVTALDAAGGEICSADSSAFTKPNSDWKPDSKDDKGGDDPKKTEPEPPCSTCDKINRERQNDKRKETV